MARTSYATGNALTRKLWEKKISREVEVEQFWSKFTGGPDSIVHKKQDLEGEKGDKLTFGIRLRQTQSFIVDGRLKGNEQNMSTYDDSVLLHSYKLGVADDGELSRKRAAFDVTSEMMALLKSNAVEAIEDLQFDAMFASGHTQIMYGGDATSVATLEATDLVTPAMIAKLYTIAKTGNHRGFPPLVPIMYKGKRWFIFLTHDDNVYDLSQDSTMQQANREAGMRGDENRLFREADLIYRNILIYGHEKCPIYTDGGAGSVPYSKSLLLGAQALIRADGMAERIVEERDDYGDQLGIGYHKIMGVKRPTFNSVVHNSIEVIAARTNVAL